MDTQDHAIYHVWVHFIPTSFYQRGEKTFGLSWNWTQVFLLHKQPLWPLDHGSWGNFALNYATLFYFSHSFQCYCGEVLSQATGVELKIRELFFKTGSDKESRFDPKVLTRRHLRCHQRRLSCPSRQVASTAAAWKRSRVRFPEPTALDSRKPFVLICNFWITPDTQ